MSGRICFVLGNLKYLPPFMNNPNYGGIYYPTFVFFLIPNAPIVLVDA